MSGRRLGGRFSSSTNSEAYQRQLTAPVHKWKKAWVSPSGLQAESSYKICKWIRVKEVANGDGDESPAPEDEEDDGEDGDNGDEPEEDEEMDLDEPKELDPQPPIQSTPIDPATAPTTIPPSPAPPAPVATPTEPPTETHDAPIPEHHHIPSNAVEMTNTAPDHTEVGHGDPGEAGIEITRPELGEAHERLAEEAVGAVGVKAVSADAGAGAGGASEEKPLETDEGLIHGEMEPPIPELAITGGDEPIEAEVAQETS